VAAGLHGLIIGFDNALLVAEMVNNKLEREVVIDGMLSIKTLFDTVTKLSNTLEKRLKIDAFAIQESHLK
jgi:hypothetical protein